MAMVYDWRVSTSICEMLKRSRKTVTARGKVGIKGTRINKIFEGMCEWARDDDGDGVREVHYNTMEGIWTGLRNFLRLFRGVNKEYLSQYAAIFPVAHDVKRITPRLLRAMMLLLTFEAI